MAIDINAGFNVGGTVSPIDSRLVLTRKQMYEMNDADMPSTYFCICKDDTRLYVYNKQFLKNSTTGKFRLATIDGVLDLNDQIDLSSYATIEQLNQALDTKADKDGLHEHNNKVLLDSLSLNNDGMLCIDGKALVTIIDTVLPNRTEPVESKGIYNFVRQFETSGYNVSVASSLPVNSSFGKAFKYNGDLYLIAGYSNNTLDEESASNNIYKYNSSTEAWEVFYSLPFAFDAATADVLNNYLYVLYSNGNFYELNLSTQQLYRYADSPRELRYAGLVAYNGNLYLLGGYYFDGSNYVTSDKTYVYNKVTNSWNEKANMPVSSANFGICSDDNFIFILGGWHIDYDSHSKHCGFYRFDGTAFEELDDCPANTSDSPNTCPSLFVYNRRVHAIGGLDSSGTSMNMHYAYIDQRWLPIENDISSLAQGQSVFADAVSMYIVGGQSVEDNIVTDLLNSFYIYTESIYDFNFDVLDGLNIDEERRLYFENDKLMAINRDSVSNEEIQTVIDNFFSLDKLT